MGQLFKSTNEHNILWSSGCSLFFVNRKQGSSRLHVAVECRFGTREETDLALLDTGAEWSGPIVLGYRGFLERIRFALDPGVVPGEQMFYFGLPG